MNKINIDKHNNSYYKSNPILFDQLLELVSKQSYANKLNSKCSKPQYKDYSELRIWILSLLPKELCDSYYTWNTRCAWILHDLHDFPKCQNESCNASIKRNFNSITSPIPIFCSTKCQITSTQFKQQCKETWQQNLGVDYPLQSKDVIAKRRKNNFDKYGCFEPSQCQKIKNKMRQTRFEKYNGKWENPSSEEKRKITNQIRYGNSCFLHSDLGIEKCTQTWLEKYGVDHPLKSNTIITKRQTTCIQLYGYKSYSQTQQFKDKWKNSEWKCIVLNKMYKSKKKHGTFNSSKDEDEIYLYLCSKFSVANVLRQYLSAEYPFRCDFYITTLQLYIECNFSWTHGGMMFDETSTVCQEKLNFWKSKAITSKYYKNAIQTWTVRDINKITIAKQHQLNYVCYWTKQELYENFDAYIKHIQ